MKVHIFNPENDMALADGQPGYTPPAIIRQMRHELYWLPNWWAAEEDIVWDGEQPLSLQPGDEIIPWGWSPALVHQLRQAGVTDAFLPSPAQIEQMRQLSHRRTAVEALGQMYADGLIADRLCGRSQECRTLDDVHQAMSQYPDSLLKSPWSSSGRGLMRGDAPHLDAWCQRIIGQQGSVVVEQQLHRLADFALLFTLDGQGGVEYRGLSLFYTNPQGAYLGNWVAPEGQKFQWLMQYVPPQVLVDIRQWWTQYLQRFDYRGPVGIDMMLCEEGVCPCIEINWRMTMGLVAQMTSEQGRFGRLVVEYIYDHYSAEIEAFS